MRKSTVLTKGKVRVVGTVLALSMAFTSVPMANMTVKAAAKPTLAKKATINEGKTKALKITKNGFQIVSVKATSEDEDIVSVVSKSKTQIKLRGEEDGVTDVTTVITAKKGKVKKKYTITTAVTVKKVQTTKATQAPVATKTPVATEAPAATQIPVNTPVAVLDNATVNTQAELDAALVNSSVKTITIGTNTSALTINSASYPDKSLIVDAPNGSVVNLATFKSIEIKNISNNAWTERASGNSFVVSSNHPVRISAPSNYNIQSIKFTGVCEYGTSTVTVAGGTLGEISVDAKVNLNISSIGYSAINKIAVNTNATVGVNCADNGRIGSVEGVDTGANVTVGATGRGIVTNIKMSRAMAGNQRTSLSVTAASTGSIGTIDIASPYVTSAIAANDTANISVVTLSDAATAMIYGNTKNQMYLNLTKAVIGTRVILNTSAVKVDLAFGLNPSAIIQNDSTGAVTVNCYNNYGNRTTETITGKNTKRVTNKLTVSKVQSSTYQILATLDTAVDNLTASNFKLYAMNNMYISSVKTSDHGKTYVLTVNRAIVANEKYTVEINGLDANAFTNTTLSASFDTISTKIELNKKSITKTSSDIGRTETIAASVLPFDGLTRTPSWYSSDSSVATVNSNGVVTFKGIGTAMITAYYGNLSESCKVTVVAAGKNKPYISTNYDNTGVIETEIGGSATVDFSVQDLGTASIKSWDVASSNSGKVSVGKTNGNQFRVISTSSNAAVSSNITISVTLSDGQKLSKTIYFRANIVKQVAMISTEYDDKNDTIRAEIGKAVDIVFSVKNAVNANVQSWDVSSSNENAVGVTKTGAAGATMFRISQRYEGPSNAVITITVKLSDGTELVKKLTFIAN